MRSWQLSRASHRHKQETGLDVYLLEPSGCILACKPSVDEVWSSARGRVYLVGFRYRLDDVSASDLPSRHRMSTCGLWLPGGTYVPSRSTADLTVASIESFLTLAEVVEFSWGGPLALLSEDLLAHGTMLIKEACAAGARHPSAWPF